MSIDPDQLRKACRDTGEAAADALSWICDSENVDLVGAEQSSLRRELRRQQTRAKKLETAVDRPMCVGVFGPSQAGKSYLVSVLARRGADPLMAVFDGKSYDFVADLNPEGGKESTGLVTRFTVGRRGDHPSGCPVVLRLLSEADILRILGNSYFFDGAAKHHPPADSSAISQALEAARNAAGEPRPGLRDEDVWEVQDYFEAQFEGDQRLTALSGLWDEAADLAPRLNHADRAELFSLLWGRLEPFTTVYRQLAESLAKLGGPAEAFCTIDALIPRETSVINVDTLHGLDRLDESATLSLKTAAGGSAELPVPLVTALTAELRIEMQDKPWDFFGHTDLLDFPGARSRQPTDLNDFFEDGNQDPLKETFLRGKVAYLFDRYVAEQELTSMLLCLGDSNQEVAALPELVANWVATTHGRTPKARADVESALFLVMTKFDRELEDKAGAGAPAGRFKARYATAIKDFLGKAHDWPKEWRPGEAFKNTFWLRNPNFKSEALFNYDDTGREIGLIEEKRARLNDLRNGFLEAAELTAHFKEPEAAWDAAMMLNDGGVAYLAEQLAPVCNPQIKLRQVRQRLDENRHVMGELLERFYVSNDPDKRLRERLATAETVIDDIYDAAEHGCFAKLVSSVQLEPGAFFDAFLQRILRPAADSPSAHEADTTRSPAAPVRGLRRPGGLKRPGESASRDSEQATKASKEGQLAEAALAQWLSDIRRNAESAKVSLAIGVSNASLNELVSEISAAAKRSNLADKISGEIRRFEYIENNEVLVTRAAALACRLINEFVSTFGFSDAPEDGRPRVGEGDEARPIFQPRPVPFDASGIGREPRDFAAEYIEDWSFGFYETVRLNAISAEGVTVNIEQNRRLGEVLSKLGMADAPSADSSAGAGA